MFFAFDSLKNNEELFVRIADDVLRLTKAWIPFIEQGLDSSQTDKYFALETLSNIVII